MVKGKAGAEGATATRRIGKEAGLQAGTEALEEGAGYLGGTAGTVKGVDVAQLAEQMLEGAIVGGGLGAGVQAGKEYYTKKQRAELADKVRSDLEARGETPTDEQIGAIVDNMIRIQKEGKADETGAGTDTGATKRGVSVSEETEAGETTGTITTSTTGGVGGDQGTPGEPGVGEGTQQGALKPWLEGYPKDEQRYETYKNNPLIKKSEEYIQKLSDRLTELGFKFSDINRTSPKELQELTDKMSQIAGSTTLTMKKLEAIDKNYKRANPAKQQQIAAVLEKDFAEVDALLEQQALQDGLQQEQAQLNAPSAPQTAEFNKYFKDSKVRDQSGQLIPLFHGTTATGEKSEGIAQFKLSKEGSLGSGIYLTPNTNFASTYTGMPSPEIIDAMEAEGKLSQEYIDKLREPYRTGELAPGQVGGNVIPVFADIQNPLVINTKDRRFDPAVDLLVALGVPQAKAESIVEKANEDKGGITKEVMTRARAKGYDGILQYRDGELSEVVAFSPNQIKSVFNKKPTWRSDILAAPSETSTAFKKWFGDSKVVDSNGNPLVVYRGVVGEKVDPTKGRPGYAIFTSDNPYIASSYSGDPSAEFGVSGGVVYPMYAKANKVIEFPVGKYSSGAQKFDMFEFDRQAQRLKPGETLVARNVYDTGPRMTMEMAEGYEKKNGDVWAFPTGTQFKSTIEAANTSPKADQADADMSRVVHPRVAQAIEANDIQGALKAVKDTAGKFFSEFASRLMELGLNTQISFNQQYALIQNELKKIEGQQNRVITWIQTVRPDIYEKHFNPANMLNRFTGMHDSFKALAEGKLGIDPKMFKQDLIDINKVYSNSITSLQARGTFFVTQNAATFNTVFGGNNNQTVMHEFTHAATHWAINNPTKLTEQQRKSLDNLNTLFRYAKAHTKNPNHNAYKNVHEFVAEAFSNAEFQKELRQMKSAMGSNMSAWSKFIQTVAKLFGVDNVLFHTLANADVLFSANYGATAVTNTLFNAPILNVQEKTRFIPQIKGKEGIKRAIETGISKGFGFLKDLISGRINWKDVNKENLAAFLESTSDQYRRYLLGALTLDQLTDMAGSDIPEFKAYVREVDNMHNTRNRIIGEGDKTIKEWGELLDTNPQKAKELGEAMIAATFAKLDPDPKTAGFDVEKLRATKDGQEALDKWRVMVAGPDGAKAVDIYRKVRTFYEKRANEYINTIKKRTRAREEAKQTKLSPEERKAEIDKIVNEVHNQITKDMIRPYFPIKRFGDYWLQIGKGQSKIFMQFEDAWARDKEFNRLKNLPENKNKELNKGQGFSEGFGQRLSDISHLQDLKELIDKSTNDIIASTDLNVKADEINSLRDALKDGLDQYYMELAPSQSIRKMFIHRQNISGPSADMLRAFAVSRQRVAYQRARFEHMPDLFSLLDSARDRLKTIPTEERTRLNDYVHELELNLKTAILEPPKQSRITTGLTQFGFLHFLTSPASALVNMMAIPGIYVPNAAAKYGMKNTTIALAKYNRLLGGTGFRSDKTGRIEFLSLSRAELKNHPVKGGPMVLDPETETYRPATLADAYNYGVEREIIDTTQTHEAVSIGEQPANEYTGNWQKFMYYASLPFHAAEKYNRETAFMASFELAYNSLVAPKSEGGKGYTPQNAYEIALQNARDLTQKTMFNYNTVNKPRYFRGDLRNVLLQFKMYPQHMTVLMYKTFHDAIGIGMKAEMESYKRSIKGSANFEKLEKAKEVELKEMKREALKTFTGMMGFTLATAGITGLPLFFIFQGVANAMHALFDDDDEPFDSENWFKNWCNRQFGDFFGDTVSRGLLSQATGMNFADRMGINLTDMWFPDVKKSQDEVQYMQNMMTNLMGPTAGALLNYVEAYKRYNDGYTERAIEVMMPAAIKNVLVGTRYMMEGKALTMKGATLDEEITPAEALAQMLGFSPEDTAKKQKSAIEMKSANEEIMSRHNDLLNAFFIAVDGNSPEDMQRVIEKIMKFNATNPAVAIDGEALYNSVQRRYKDRALANITGGMPVNKKLMPYLDGMRDYAR